METKYHTLKRPRRKLCYLTNKKSPPKQWTEKLTLVDIDGMFDDLDSSSNDDDRISPSPLLQSFDSETNQIENNISPSPQKGHPTTKLPSPGGDVMHPARTSFSPKLDIDLSIPFEVHGPVKTSSPIEENMVVDAVEEEHNERALVVPQILHFEEAKTDPVHTQRLSNGDVIEPEDDSDLESPPSKVALRKQTMSNHKNQVAGSCKDSDPVKEKKHRKPQTPVVVQRKTPSRQENTEPAVSAPRQDPELLCPEKISGDNIQPSQISTCGRKDIKAFLQKVREAERSKPAWGLQSLVKVPTPPEPEDEFLILEDDAPLIYIPSKTSNRKRLRQKETNAEKGNAAKDTSTDNRMKDETLETAQKDKELEKANPKLGSHVVNQKMKKNKEEKNEVIGHYNDELSTPEDFPGGDVMEQEKPNHKKQLLKKVQSKEGDKPNEELKYRESRETDEETHSQKMGRKSQRSSEVKSSKSANDGKQNAKTSKTKSLKRITNVMKGIKDIKQTQWVEENRADAEDLGSFSDKEFVKSEAQKGKAKAHGKDKQNKLPVVSEESSSEGSQLLGKRKRKQPGQWWLSCPQNTEETKDTDNQLTLKKSKQSNKKPKAAVPSPVKAKKDRALKRKNQKRPVPSSSESTNTTEPQKTKRTKNRITRGETLDKKKTADEVLKVTGVDEMEDQDQQQEVLDQDLDIVHPSPLVSTERNLSHSSGNQVFQRVYHHVSNENMPRTPSRPQQQLREGQAEKRRRKPPHNWWLINVVSEDVEHSPSQPHHLHHKDSKHCKEKNNQSKQSRTPRLGTPKNGNMPVSPKPLGGTPTSSLKPKPLSAPKTVKRSLAMFKDIFTSATETENVRQNNRPNASAHPAEEVGVFHQNLETAPDNNYQSEDLLNELQSGPSSMIQLQQYEENEDLTLPSSRVYTALSISDLCGPPLKPLILQPKDKANLREWLKSLWPTDSPNAAEITPNQFDWYVYQDRAIGFLLDVNCGSACLGRILLGSYMKKPLWVDHSATTVFNLLTSSVKVVIDSKESHIVAGQCFTVQCGHAYSIQNACAQPAVLYFTRILAESSD